MPRSPGARLLCLNSPLNPTGTAFERDALLGICEAILEENEARERRGERPLYLMYDHIYWMLCFGGTRHVTPAELVPEMARYTIFVDGISKALRGHRACASAGRVGPVDVIDAHVGRARPRRRLGAARRAGRRRSSCSTTPDGIREYHDRASSADAGAARPAARGVPGDEGARPPGREHPADGRHLPHGAHPPLRPPHARRRGAAHQRARCARYVLEAAGIGIVPFQAFGSEEDDGWFRLSVGAVSMEEIEAALPRLEEALRRLT